MIFVHTIMTKKTMTKVNAVYLYEEMCSKFDLPSQDFAAFLRKINETFTKYDFNLISGNDKDGKPVYCLVWK